MLDFINEHLSTILTFIGGLISGITLTITTQKMIFNRNGNKTNQNNNTINSSGNVKFIGGDDNSKE